MNCNDCEIQLKKMDEILYQKIDQLRNNDGPNENSQRDHEIMGIARRDGGLGIYSYSETQSLARKASLSNSRFELVQRNLSTMEFMVKLHEEQETQGNTGSENRYQAVGPTPLPGDTQPLRQKTLMQAYLQDKLSKLLSSLPDDEKTSYTDNISITRALGAIPRGRKNLLFNNQIAANLNILLLKRKHPGDICICGCSNTTNHFEVCTRCPNVSSNKHYRHNATRDAMAQAINQSNEGNATIEPKVFKAIH